MKPRNLFYLVALLTALTGCAGLLVLTTASPPASSAAPLPPHVPLADNPNPPVAPVKLIFIHHSTGGNWLADIGEHDQAGGLGQALMANNYFVSATNYQWGPRTDPGDPDTAIGSRTDVPNWPEWFTGPNRETIMSAVYAENGQNIGDFGNWSRLATDPGGPNEIIMFKSCFPNSNLYGAPNDPPLATPNDEYTVANFKAVYNNILTYFAAHQEKLFIVITAPPLAEGEYVVMDNSTPAAERAANARAFNNWLLNDWLDSYAHNNVAVFDYYNVLTSNGIITRTDDPSRNDEPNDYAQRPDGNHHYWNGSAITHTQTVANNYSAYPYYSGGVDDYYDSHPTGQGQQKATAEFVPWLNVIYNRWKGSAPSCIALTDAGIAGPTSGYTGTQYTFTAVITPANASMPITYTWTPAPASGQGTATAHYTWPTVGAKTITLTAQNCGGSDTDTHVIVIAARPAPSHFLYLPVILRNYSPTPPACAVPLTGVTITGPTGGYTDTLYTFTAVPTPANATLLVAYTWTPLPESGQSTASASYRWTATGSKTIGVTAGNCGGAHSAGDSHTIIIQAAPSGDLIRPGDFTYLGAFRLPDDGERPRTFEYGGNAMTYNPDNNTLFITGHDRLPYGELPDGDQVAEVSIPTPLNSRNVEDLPVATFVQGFHNPAAGHFTSLEEIPKVGLEYLNHPDTGPKIHITWGRHLQQLEDYLPSQGWFDPDLENPDFQGEWFIGDRNPNSANGYMFEIPAAWADTHAQGRYLATGRFSPGGLGGMGPALLAYRPWLTGGVAPISGTHLAETALLLYESAMVTDVVTHCLDTYQHADAWEGGAWLTTPSGKSAVLFAGTKGSGIKYWYGYIHPTNPLSPCVDLAVIGDFYPCRLADGTECPETDLVHCCEEGVDCVSARGWWSTRFDAQFILYDPAQLAQVAAGALESWQPQPYAVIDVDDYLYLNPPEWDEFEVGWGAQRRHRIGDATFDRVNGRLYVLELYADGGKPVVHVWRVE